MPKDVELPDLISSYARLLIGVGVALRPGQLLHVEADIEHAPLVRALTSAGYAAGAGYVDVCYVDQFVKKALIEGADEQMLDWTPEWMVERCRWVGEQQGASILLTGPADPDLFRDLDGARVGRARERAYVEEWLRQTGERSVSWTIAGCPTPGWSKAVFGAANVERLWRAIADTVRLNEDDPAEAWRAHGERLLTRATSLNERHFDAIRYRGPGTDLTIGLLAGSTWIGGPKQTAWDQTHFANMPTEEVFTSPDRTRAEGRVRSTRPLALLGAVVQGLELELHGGRIVDVQATSGADVVRAQIEADPRAGHLGELALVDSSSRVGQSGLVFLNTLFDENATCHIAYGKGFPYCVSGAEELDSGGQMALGLNDASTHTDLMIGGEEVEVDGLDAQGKATALLRGGDWQL